MCKIINCVFITNVYLFTTALLIGLKFYKKYENKFTLNINLYERVGNDRSQVTGQCSESRNVPYMDRIFGTNFGLPRIYSIFPLMNSYPSANSSDTAMVNMCAVFFFIFHILWNVVCYMIFLKLFRTNIHFINNGNFITQI